MEQSRNQPSYLLLDPYKYSTEQLPSADELVDHIPIDLDYFTPNKACSFPLYLYHPSKKKFVLFKSHDLPISTHHYQLLSKNGQRPVYVPRDFGYELQKYISDNLVDIVSDPKIPVQRKSKQFHKIANTVLQNLFEMPPNNQEFIKTARNISDSMTTLLIEGPQALYHLYQLRSYDYYTFSHSMNVCVLAVGFFMYLENNLNEDYLKSFTRGVLLHDIGKCDIPTSLTTKKGPLTPQEWEQMRSHTTKGYERLKEDHDLLEEHRLISLLHHEAIDGSGYPLGLKYDELSMCARLSKVVDVYDALTSRRSYKAKMGVFESLHLMITEMKEQIDQELLKQFIHFLDQMGKLKVQS